MIRPHAAVKLLLSEMVFLISCSDWLKKIG